MAFGWFSPRSLAVALFMLLASCSSNDESNGQVASEVSTSTSTSASVETTPASSAPEAPLDETAAEESASDDADTAPTSAAPVRTFDDSELTMTEAVDTSVWVSRVSMTSSNIEMTWSDFDGAVEYRLHRVARTTDQRPDPSVMTDENEIYIATEAGRTVDETVVPDTEYWYGLRALANDGTMMAHGWHAVAAVDDEEPPAQVEVQSAEVLDGEVVLTWTEPSENYELHAYRILRGVDGGELETIATTWNTDQRSLIDDSPPTGTLIYAVEAIDFHWNSSTPGTIEVNVPLPLPL